MLVLVGNGQFDGSAANQPMLYNVLVTEMILIARLWLVVSKKGKKIAV